MTYESAITQLNPSPQTLSVVGCAKQPIPLSDDSVTFDTLHLVARNLDFRLSLVQLANQTNYSLVTLNLETEPCLSPFGSLQGIIIA